MLSRQLLGKVSASGSIGFRTMSSRTTLFADPQHADLYATYRPTYPPDLFEKLFEFHKEGGGRFGTALDMATGTGAVLPPLASNFERVVGVDVSAAQLATISGLGTNVETQEATAESLEVAPGSMDLITVGQALHWFDIDVWYKRAWDALSVDGSLASFGYATCTLGSPELDAVVMDVYDGILGPYWDDRRKLVDAQYKGLEPPESLFTTTRDIVPLRKPMPLKAFVGYLSTWSSFQTYSKTNDGEALLKDTQRRLLDALGPSASEDTVLDVEWPLFTLFHRKVSAGTK